MHFLLAISCFDDVSVEVGQAIEHFGIFKNANEDERVEDASEVEKRSAEGDEIKEFDIEVYSSGIQKHEYGNGYEVVQEGFRPR